MKHPSAADGPAAMTIARGSGPTNCVNARPGVGAVAPDATRVVVGAGATGLLSHPVDLSSTVRIRPGDALVYYVYPEFVPGALPPTGALEWYEGGYGATGIAVSLEFDDGRTLAGADLTDHHGAGVGPQAQGRSKTLAVDQWTRKEVSLQPFAGATIRSASLEFSAHGADHELVAWIDGPRIERTAASQTVQTPAEYVDTRRGTHTSAAFSRGNTIPATARPNGAVFTVPLTCSDRPSWPYAYHLDNDDENFTPFGGIALSHSASPWFGDWGMLHVTAEPVNGDQSGNRFRHADEIARPHEYVVRLENGITVHAAPTRHGTIAEFTFPQGFGRVVFDERAPQGQVSFINRGGETMIVGRNSYHGQQIAGAPTVHFAARFDPAPVSLPAPDQAGNWADLRELDFDRPAVTVRITSSLIDADHALAALDEELGGSATLDSVIDEAHTEWDALLGRVRIDGATHDRAVTVYSALYRLFLYPNLIGERRARGGIESANVFAFRPEEPVTDREPVSGDVTVNNGFWDTYRTAWPAYALLAPELASRLLDGLLAHFRHAGWVPRWTAPGFIDAMVGTSSDIVFADAIAKGVPMAEMETAYDSALRNAMTPSPHPAAGRKGITRSIFTGYVPSEIREGMSWSLENCISDFALAQFSTAMLQRLGTEHPRAAEFAANADYFQGRSRSYALLFDHTTAFFRGRRLDGSRTVADEEFEPRRWGGDYTETNAWGMNFTVPHDGAGLALLFGDRGALERRLDAYFDHNEIGDEAAWGWYGRNIHEMTEARDIRRGMFAVSNQPAHHIPYMYAHTDAKHHTQEIVRDALERLFLGSELGQGYPGDEDNGEMSAWYLFGAFGLYPFTPGTEDYVITSPLFPRVTLDKGDGRPLVIETDGIAPGNVYIQSLHVDGKEWHRITIDHRTLTAGATLRFKLGPTPSDWFAGSYPDSATNDENTGVLRDLDQVAARTVTASFPGSASLFDNDSTTVAEIPPAGTVRLQTAEPHRVRLYTVTCGPSPADGPRRWTLAAEHEGEVTVVDIQSDVTWRWPSETRVFAIRGRVESAVFTFLFDGPMPAQVAELQLLSHASIGRRPGPDAGDPRPPWRWPATGTRSSSTAWPPSAPPP